MLHPDSRGHLALASDDPYQAIRIHQNFFSAPRDMEVLLEGLDIVRSVMTQPALDPHRGKENNTGADVTSREGLEAHIRESSVTVHHPLGTCRMGVDEMAVVDGDLNVRGIDGLRVVDASVMPDMTSGNINAPVIMIAEKPLTLLKECPSRYGPYACRKDHRPRLWQSQCNAGGHRHLPGGPGHDPRQRRPPPRQTADGGARGGSAGSPKVVLVSDHFSPCTDAESANILKVTREWAAENGVINFYDQQGICHVVTPERGHLRPGMFAVGGDSHSPDRRGVRRLHVWHRGHGHAWRTGYRRDLGQSTRDNPDQLVRRTPPGCISKGYGAQNVRRSRHGRGKIPGNPVHRRDHHGAGHIRAYDDLQHGSRAGAQAGLIEPDAKTAAYIEDAGSDPGDWEQFRGDDGARVAATHNFDAGALTLQVAAPHSPANATDIANMEKVEIDQFYIGACTGAKLNDLKMAADVLINKKVGPGKRLTVAPASARILTQATKLGIVETLLDAGANLLYGLWRLCGLWRWRAGRG